MDLEPEFIADLKRAPGNNPQLGDGAKVYKELVKPCVADLKKGLAHYGISSLVEEYAPNEQIFSFQFARNAYRCDRTAARTLAVGAVSVRSRVTGEALDGMFVVLHLGGYDFHCAVRARDAARDYEGLKEKLFRSFTDDSTRNLLQAIDANLDGDSFALKDLFIDERRKIGRLLLEGALERSRDHYRRIYEESRDVMRLLKGLRIPAPESLKRAAEYVLTSRLEAAVTGLRSGEVSDVQLNELAAAVLREAEALGCKADLSGLKEALEQAVYSRLELCGRESDEAKAESALRFLKLAERLEVSLDLWRLQNVFWRLVSEPGHKTETAAASIDELGNKLKFSRLVVQATKIGNRNK
jgi:hypothetical protein